MPTDTNGKTKKTTTTGSAMTILQVLGFDKCNSNEIFTTKNLKRAEMPSAKGGSQGKQLLVLKQSQGYPKEYSGISRVHDSTDHSEQELRKVLLSMDNGQQKTTQTKPVNPDSSSLVSLFSGQGLDANFFFLTSRPDDFE